MNLKCNVCKKGIKKGDNFLSLGRNKIFHVKCWEEIDKKG